MTKRVQAVLEQSAKDFMASGAIMQGHFQRHDNQHSKWYFNAHALFWTGRLWSAVQDLASVIDQAVVDEIDAIVGPESLGKMVASGLQATLGSRRNRSRPAIHCVPIERKFVIVGPEVGKTIYHIRDYYHKQMSGMKVLFADDAIASGVTTNRGHELIRAAGAHVVAEAGIADLCHYTHPTRFSIWRPPTEDIYPVHFCPMCKSQDPEVRKITRF